MTVADQALSHLAASGKWPSRRSAILDWLIAETRSKRFLDTIFVEFCSKLRASGIPLARATLHLQILHPQWFGARLLWWPGQEEADWQTFAHETTGLASEAFLNSPMKAIRDGADQVRRRLERPGEVFDFPICTELAAAGLTDYVAWPLDFTLDKRHVMTIASDRPGGFADDELDHVLGLLPLLALVLEIRFKNRLARTLLETYVGPHASDEILRGSITRGSGATVNAVILICDLRGFTAISELWPRDDVIALLNEYFDAMSEPVERHDGEILKFIGDGMLAIFPLDRPDASRHAFAAATEARDAMAALNASRVARGLERLGYGLGVHIGDVMYGNIGSRARLDFTVIGPAVNIAARLESLTKVTGRRVLFSGAFVAALEFETGLEALGAFPLRGVGEPIEVYAFPEPAVG